MDGSIARGAEPTPSAADEAGFTAFIPQRPCAQRQAGEGGSQGYAAGGLGRIAGAQECWGLRSPTSASRLSADLGFQVLASSGDPTT